MEKLRQTSRENGASMIRHCAISVIGAWAFAALLLFVSPV
jgi:hypothetical protein